jgi:RND family efflux transporter MFP subunit
VQRDLKKWLYIGVAVAVLAGLVVWRFIARNAAQAQVMGGAASRTGAGAGAAGGGGAGAGGRGGRGGGAGGPSSVELASTTSRDIVQSVQSVGNVESPFKVEISPKTAGRITYLQVREGDTVTPGEVLLRIDPSDLEAAVVQQQANIAEARSRYAQAQITQGATNVGITSQIQQQQAGLTSAQADFNQVQGNYEAQVAAAQAQVSAASQAVSSAQASLTKENASLANALAKYNRTYSLYLQGFVAAQDVDDARTAVEVQRGTVAVAQGQISSAQSQLSVQRQNLLITQRKGQSDIAASKAKVSQAKATLSVATANRSQSPAYQMNLAALRSQVDAAVAQLQQAQAKLRDTVVRSNIAGTVTLRKADPGALASPGSPVLEIQYVDWVYVTTAIPVEASNQIHSGQTAQVFFDSLPGRSFAGPLTNINLAADPQSRQFGARIKLNNPDHALRPGMYARVSVVTGRVHASVVVPREAVATSQKGGTTVTVVDSQGVAHVRPVKVGASDDKGIEITQGVAAGEKVVVLTYTPLREGQKVATGGAQQGGRRQGAGGGAAGASGRRRQQQQ